MIRDYGAPTTGELKAVLKTDSVSILKALGSLLMDHKIFVMGAFNGVVWMEVTGRKGYPSVRGARKRANKADPDSTMRDTVDPKLVREEHGHGTPMKEGGGKAIREGRAVTPASGTRRSTRKVKPFTPEEFGRKHTALKRKAEEEDWSQKRLDAAIEQLAERSPYRQ